MNETIQYPTPARVFDSVATTRAALNSEERSAMLALLDAHFSGVTAEQFARDLDEKDWVLRIFAGERLVGFSTLAVSSTTGADGGPLHVIYSGDTIMAPEAWGSRVLSTSWIRLVRRVQATLPPGPCYWLLLSSGFRTYRFLPVFWKNFWPRHDAATPLDVQALLDRLARERFGENFNAASGVVRFLAPQSLRAELANVPGGRVEGDRHIAFFLRQNPGWLAGDELVCLTSLEDENLTNAGLRVVREAGA